MSDGTGRMASDWSEIKCGQRNNHVEDKVCHGTKCWKQHIWGRNVPEDEVHETKYVETALMWTKCPRFSLWLQPTSLYKGRRKAF